VRHNGHLTSNEHSFCDCLPEGEVTTTRIIVQYRAFDFRGHDDSANWSINASSSFVSSGDDMINIGRRYEDLYQRHDNSTEEVLLGRKVFSPIEISLYCLKCIVSLCRRPFLFTFFCFLVFRLLFVLVATTL
jgi:hypothetical protein